MQNNLGFKSIFSFKTCSFTNRTLRSEKGMTLVEIMIVLAILGAIIALVATNVADSRDKAKLKEAKIQLSLISNALQMYYTECGKYPEALTAIADGDSACSNWIPDKKMKKKLNDPWNREFYYTRTGSEFILKSYGKDGKEGGTALNADIVSDDSAEEGSGSNE